MTHTCTPGIIAAPSSATQCDSLASATSSRAVRGEVQTVKPWLSRVVDGVEQRLCWRFQVHGRSDVTYEPASGQHGPFDRDRQRHLKAGETFQRLDRSGSPRKYGGLVWQPKRSIAGSGR
ncbi:uncharacterized protein SOCE836_012360 [Sorangium cellulosum]|uniref:Uncharacterized protein n=1 Tax=Sorangium cellulosum TaxID=56 RepID=A0A4P2QHT8_SORCE|nr:uncharacterized protein SOCE836_012360 [Sorangium cellulosum]WCQ88540.1 hypothetical protein NQZ70_01219 [Sorangium sp. Soce836]